MASFRQDAPSYIYYSNDQNSMSQELSGILAIFVHHARKLHNICIYDNQDVYAKFSLTCNPDDTVSTRIINGGGKNPDFNQKLSLKLPQTDSVLKCEVWMLSRVRNLLEDQLLGFALVPISMVAGRGKITEEFSLSSTHLFHSPAGTVKLSLSLSSCLPLKSFGNSSSITSEVVFLDRHPAESGVDPVEYSRIEFPDIHIVHQNQQMVSEYLSLVNSSPNLTGPGSFLRLGVSLDDSEMTLNESASPCGSGSIQTSSGLLSSTTTSLSDDNRNTADSTSTEQKIRVSAAEISMAVEQENDLNSSANENDNNIESLAKMNVEAEQSAMQQQIVDMYMKSMHQFTESLAKMKLPMDLDKHGNEGPKNTVQSQTSNNAMVEVDKKKDGSRVFYGSRAFF